jgi:hypothetical protein
VQTIEVYMARSMENAHERLQMLADDANSMLA